MQGHSSESWSCLNILNETVALARKKVNRLSVLAGVERGA